MPPFRHWADLPPELLCLICDGLGLKSYVSSRGACTAWRCALVPPTPSLLLVPDEDRCCPSAASLPMHRSFALKPFPPGRPRVVGSSNGWIALSIDSLTFSIFNPTTATEIILPPLIYKGTWFSKSKLVFTPNPASDDFIATAICDLDRLAYVTSGARRWAILDPVPLARGDRLVDLVYHENGKVYCLTFYGDVHVLLLPERHRRKSILVEKPTAPLLSSTEKPLQVRRPQHQRCIRLTTAPPISVKLEPEPDLNAPATVEPLVSGGNLPFSPATCFAPPYNTLRTFTSAKNLVFCEGNLYQIWRNTSCRITLHLPAGGGRRRLEDNEVFVLRYQPQRQPCWDVVTDLGGYSVFLGRNNAVSMYCQGVPGLKGNCVYWIGGRGRDQAMVFDMTTGRSTPCLPAAPGGAPQSTICWYFFSDMENNCSNSRGESVNHSVGIRANPEKQQDSIEE
jgi:hypothetical protein